MKAEHRKELKSNELMEKMRVWGDWTKQHGWLIVGVVAVVIGIVVAYTYLTRRAQSRDTVAWNDLWQQLELAQDGNRLGGAADAREELKLKFFKAERGNPPYKGMAAERAARLVLADLTFKEGYQLAVSGPGAALAAARFEEASKLYEELSNDPGDSPDLAIRALMGAARSEEWRGQLDRATFFYQELVKRYGSESKENEHPLVAAARKHLEQTEAGKPAASFFGTWIATLAGQGS